jgi:hypothetical protein
LGRNGVGPSEGANALERGCQLSETETAYQGLLDDEKGGLSFRNTFS